MTQPIRGKCLKRCVALQLVLTIALLVATVIAYLIVDSKKKPTNLTTPPSRNQSNSSTQGEYNSTSFQDKQGKDSYDFITTIDTGEHYPIDDDSFIITIEKPREVFWESEKGVSSDGGLLAREPTSKPSKIPTLSPTTMPTNVPSLESSSNNIASSIPTKTPGDVQNVYPAAALRGIIHNAAKQTGTNYGGIGNNSFQSRFNPKHSRDRPTHEDGGSSVPSQSPSRIEMYETDQHFNAPTPHDSIAASAATEDPTAGTTIPGVDDDDETEVVDYEAFVIDGNSIQQSSLFNSTSDVECPIEVENGIPCTDLEDMLQCSYDYVYTGCNADSLNCSPMLNCQCIVPSGNDTGIWFCEELEVPSCHLRRHPELPTVGTSCDPNGIVPIIFDTPASGLPVSGSVPRKDACPSSPRFGTCDDYRDNLRCSYDYMFTGCTWDGLKCSPTITCNCFDGQWDCYGEFEAPCSRLSDQLPWGEVCDPAVSLPSPPPVTKITECPPALSFGSCSDYEENLECEYNHVYRGCTWDTLTCSSTIGCSCRNGIWQCATEFVEPCESIIDGTSSAKDFPWGNWGNSCDPTESTGDIVPTDVTNAAIIDASNVPSSQPSESKTADPTEMPTKMRSMEPSSNPSQFITPLPSNSPSLRKSEAPSQNPSELPSLMHSHEPSLRGSEAPSSILSEAPTENTANATALDTAINLSMVCPTTFENGKCYHKYADNLKCMYNYVYRGCTWEDLVCLPSITCECDHWFGFWQCESAFATCASIVNAIPNDLPLGSPCDPRNPLPSPSN